MTLGPSGRGASRAGEYPEVRDGQAVELGARRARVEALERDLELGDPRELRVPERELTRPERERGRADLDPDDVTTQASRARRGVDLVVDVARERQLGDPSQRQPRRRRRDLQAQPGLELAQRELADDDPRWAGARLGGEPEPRQHREADPIPLRERQIVGLELPSARSACRARASG